MKAFLAWHDRPFRKTHSLEELGEACLSIDGTLRALVDRAVPLTEYAWALRYPGEMVTPEPREANAALALALELVAGILERLPAEAKPAGS